MSMSRRHFVKLAALVANLEVDSEGKVPASLVAERLADLCASENPHFDRDRFMEATVS